MLVAPKNIDIGEVEPASTRDTVALGIIGCVLLSVLCAIPLMGVSHKTTGYPQEMYDDIRAVAGERMYNDYNTGTDLVQHDIKVFQDSRYDLYTANTYRNKTGLSENTIIMDAQALETSCAKEDTIRNGVIQKYDFTSILISSETELAKWLTEHGWYAYKSYNYLYDEEMKNVDSDIVSSELTLYLPKKN